MWVTIIRREVASQAALQATLKLDRRAVGQ